MADVCGMQELVGDCLFRYVLDCCWVCSEQQDEGVAINSLNSSMHSAPSVPASLDWCSLCVAQQCNIDIASEGPLLSAWCISAMYCEDCTSPLAVCGLQCLRVICAVQLLVKNAFWAWGS